MEGLIYLTGFMPDVVKVAFDIGVGRVDVLH